MKNEQKLNTFHISVRLNKSAISPSVPFTTDALGKSETDG
jgi:hypothetical protein